MPTPAPDALRRLLTFVLATIAVPLAAVAAPDVDHSLFDELLSRHVLRGRVDYAGFQRDEARLDRYLEQLAQTDPQELDRNARYAFYINLYNAWTIKLILSAYPDIDSIKDLGGLLTSPWEKKLVRLITGTVSLDHIEHDILRPEFRDPRVHFAINCAARSCPPLISAAYTAERLDEQLDANTRAFVNDPESNYLKGETLYVSRIFKWFKKDFDNDVAGFFRRWAGPEFKARLDARRERLKVKYLDYDWGLNGS